MILDAWPRRLRVACGPGQSQREGFYVQFGPIILALSDSRKLKV